MLRIDNPDSILALAILTACKSEKPTIPEASRVLYEMKLAGINIGYIALRRVPGGEFYSEDADNRLGFLVAGGHGIHDPTTRQFKLTEKGEALLREAVGKGISWQEVAVPQA